MTPRELFLLSPYQVPAHHPLLLGNDDVAAFLNGYAALWHPAVIQGAGGPPRVASPYDHEQPAAGHIFAVPDTPPSLLPTDWAERAREAGAVAFRAFADRESTFADLRSQLNQRAFFELPPEKVRPFIGIGFGFMMVNALYEAMEHENLLSVTDFWQDVQKAVIALDDPDPGTFRRSLQAAADRLLAAREIIYPVAIHVVDLASLNSEGAGSLPAAFQHGLPVNFVASATELEEYQQTHPNRFAELRASVARHSAEVIGGCLVERADDLQPLESQLWNLLAGLSRARELLGTDVRVYGRRKHAFAPQSPVVLANAGLQRALIVALDDCGTSNYPAAVVAFTTPDGRQIDGFARTPHAAHDSSTFFHLAHYLHKTIMQDHAATLAFVHGTHPDSPGYADLVELSRFGPILGQWTTVSKFLGDVTAGEYAGTLSPDDHHPDHLSQRVESGSTRPVSAFANHARQRRRIDTLFTLAAFTRGLSGTNDSLPFDERLVELESATERSGLAADLLGAEREISEVLCRRLLVRAQGVEPGFLVLNPCSFARRVALELPPATAPLPINGPVKACQLQTDQCKLVVEVPGLGFAWLPRSGPAGTAPMTARMRLADDRHVRNEFFEAEVDSVTGGLRGIHDHQTRVHRIGQQLAFNPGSTMRATSVKAVSTGPALGEIVADGELVGEQGQVLARFRQRFRAWLGRPVLEVRVEIEPALGPAGYPWHAYYAARFAWRDERALLLRGINGTAYVTSHARPQTPDYLELRQGRQNTVIFPCGLPFHQRHGSRMLDVILIPPGEEARSFDLAIALDREHPMLTAQGLISPVPCIEVADGPPHVGDSGWLFHLDSPNLLLTSLRAAPNDDALTARLLECGQHGGQAEMRFPRRPRQAELCDARGTRVRDAFVEEDRATFEVLPGEFLQLRVEF
jgi:hypothetical protein